MEGKVKPASRENKRILLMLWNLPCLWRLQGAHVFWACWVDEPRGPNRKDHSISLRIVEERLHVLGVVPLFLNSSDASKLRSTNFPFDSGPVSSGSFSRRGDPNSASGPRGSTADGNRAGLYAGHERNTAKADAIARRQKTRTWREGCWSNPTVLCFIPPGTESHISTLILLLPIKELGYGGEWGCGCLSAFWDLLPHAWMGTGE